MKLISEVQLAPGRKIKGSERYLISYFVTGVLMLAAFAFVSELYRSNSTGFDQLTRAMERVMKILAAACPCGLGLAVPSAIMAGLDASWLSGALITGGASSTMQRLKSITHVVLDKTGTLTNGRLEVTSTRFSSHPIIESEHLALRLIALAEASHAHEHPVAKAIFQYTLRNLEPTEREFQGLEREIVENVLGKGLCCKVRIDDVSYLVHIGSREYMKDNSIKIEAEECEKSTSTTVHASINHVRAARFQLRDTIRKEASAIIAKLKSKGLEVSMLTGDVQDEAERIAADLGNIKILGAKTLPHQKRDWIRTLRSQGHTVAMVGDGLNDCLAQSAADVGVTLSFNPTASMAGAADVVLMSSNLESLPVLFSIANGAVSQARFNMRWSVSYNAVALALAWGVLEPYGVEVTA